MPAPAPTPTPASERRALVIDDEEPIRTAIRLMLQDEGYAVEEADNGRDGLELLRWASAPAVAVLDLLMPGQSGVRILQLAAHEPRLARHRYVVTTAVHIFRVADLVADLAQYLPPGHLAVVAKPFDMGHLAAEVERAWRQLEREGAASQGHQRGTPVRGRELGVPGYLHARRVY